MWPISALCDLDLWPPDTHSWSFHALDKWTTYANLRQNRFNYFQNIVFTSLVADERTGGREHPACQSGLADVWKVHVQKYFSQISLNWKIKLHFGATRVLEVGHIPPPPCCTTCKWHPSYLTARRPCNSWIVLWGLKMICLYVDYGPRSHYCHATFLCLQGVFIFIFHAFCRGKVRNILFIVLLLFITVYWHKPSITATT